MALGIVLIVLGVVFSFEGVSSFCFNDAEYYPIERRDAIILMIIGVIMAISGGVILWVI